MRRKESTGREKEEKRRKEEKKRKEIKETQRKGERGKRGERSADKGGESTPAEFQPWTPETLLPPVTLSQAKKRTSSIGSGTKVNAQSAMMQKINGNLSRDP